MQAELCGNSGILFMRETYWCQSRITVFVAGDVGPPVTLDRPFARIGSHPNSDVVLPGAPKRAIYLHATSEGLFCRRFDFENERQPLSMWVLSGQPVEVGGYRVYAELNVTNRCRKLPLELDAMNSLVGPEVLIRVKYQGQVLATRRLHRRLTLLGRERPASMRIRHPMVSTGHCALFYDQERVWVIDLLSGNGTLVAGVPVVASEIHSGQSLQIGATVIEILQPGFGENFELLGLSSASEIALPDFPDASNIADARPCPSPLPMPHRPAEVSNADSAETTNSALTLSGTSGNVTAPVLQASSPDVTSDQLERAGVPPALHVTRELRRSENAPPLGGSVDSPEFKQRKEETGALIREQLVPLRREMSAMLVNYNTLERQCLAWRQEQVLQKKEQYEHTEAMSQRLETLAAEMRQLKEGVSMQERQGRNRNLAEDNRFQELMQQTQGIQQAVAQIEDRLSDMADTISRVVNRLDYLELTRRANESPIVLPAAPRDVVTEITTVPVARSVNEMIVSEMINAAGAAAEPTATSFDVYHQVADRLVKRDETSRKNRRLVISGGIVVTAIVVLGCAAYWGKSILHIAGVVLSRLTLWFPDT